LMAISPADLLGECCTGVGEEELLLLRQYPRHIRHIRYDILEAGSIHARQGNGGGEGKLGNCN
jgi:hypothetical protein